MLNPKLSTLNFKPSTRQKERATPVAFFKASQYITSMVCHGATICVVCSNGAVCILKAPFLVA